MFSKKYFTPDCVLRNWRKVSPMPKKLAPVSKQSLQEPAKLNIEISHFIPFRPCFVNFQNTDNQPQRLSLEDVGKF